MMQVCDSGRDGSGYGRHCQVCLAGRQWRGYLDAYACCLVIFRPSIDPLLSRVLLCVLTGLWHIRFGTTTMLGRQIASNTLGYLTWQYGLESSMKTDLVRSSETSTTKLTAQVEWWLGPRWDLAAYMTLHHAYTAGRAGSGRCRVHLQANG